MNDVLKTLRCHFLDIFHDSDIADEAVTELKKAYVKCDKSTFERYLKLGMDPNLQLSKEHVPLTCLMTFAESGHWTEIAKLLLESGASPNAKDWKGVPLMFSLVSSGETELVSLAIKYGADLNLLGNDGENVVLVAVHYKQVECLKLLLDHGADFDVADYDGNTAVMWAAGRSNGIGMQRSLTCLKLLIEHGAKINTPNKKGFTPLMAASLIREYEAVKLLLNSGANIEASDKNRDTALMKAIDGNSEELVRLFIQYGVNVNTANNKGVTPLMIASSFCILEDLILAGADVNAVDHLGRSVLHFQTNADQWEHVRVLIEFGANHLAKNKSGESPLQIAIRRKNSKTIFLLIDAGSKLDDFNNNNVGLIHDALLPWDYFNTIDIFQKLNTPTLWRELIFYTSQYRSLTYRLVDLLLKCDKNVNMEGEGNVTPIMLASGCGDLKAVKFLLQHGADPCTMDKDGRSALSYAAKSGHIDIVRQLLRHGCNPNIEDNNGNLPIYYAAFFKHIEIVLLLMLDLAFYYCFKFR
ncbi:putative ankyrin repeat protein [Armadillidium vulgare]|nr:putative ankyrin repeat protein [Armadillidium vulgare]